MWSPLKKIKNINKWVTVKKRVMIFSPTTLTRSNAVKRHQKFKFPIDEFFHQNSLFTSKKNIKQNSKLYFCFFCFCHYCYWKMELSIRVQKKQKTVFVISFFSFYFFLSAMRQLFLKNLFLTSEIFVEKKMTSRAEKHFLPYFTIITATIITAIEKAKKFQGCFNRQE